MSYDLDWFDLATEDIDRLASRVEDRRDRAEFLRDLAFYCAKEGDNVRFDDGEMAWSTWD